MADQRWIGAAADVKQVTTIAVTGTWATDDTGTLTINNKDLTVTAGADVATTDIAAIIAQAVNQTSATANLLNDESRNFGGLEIPEFAEIEASSSSSTITLESRTAGVPFTVTASESTAGSGALGSPTEATAATGKNFADNVDNYSGGALPGGTDTLYFDGGSVDVLHGLDGLNDGTSLSIANEYTGNIGLPKVNARGYVEYRSRFLIVEPTGTQTLTHNIGSIDGPPPNGRRYIDFGTNTATSLTVYVNDADTATSDGAAVQFVGGDAAFTLHVHKGSASVGAHTAENPSGVSEVNVFGSSAVVHVGMGVDTTTWPLNVFDGVVTMEAVTGGATNVYGGRLNTQAGGTVGAVNIFGPGTIEAGGENMGAVQVHRGATLDLSRIPENTFSPSSIDLYAGFILRDPNAAYLGAIDFNGCTPSDGTLVVRDHLPLDLGRRPVMAKNYLLSESALKDQRIINAIVRGGNGRRRPTQKRRRFRGGNGGSVAAAKALATGSIAAASDFSSSGVKPGVADGGVILMEWKKDAGGEIEFPLEEWVAIKENDDSDPPQEVNATRFCINASGTAIRGSEEEAPVALLGLLETVDSSNGSEEVFYAMSVFDLAGLPGHIQDGDREDNAQAPFSYGDERGFQLDRDEC